MSDLMGSYNFRTSIFRLSVVPIALFVVNESVNLTLLFDLIEQTNAMSPQ